MTTDRPKFIPIPSFSFSSAQDDLSSPFLPFHTPPTSPFPDFPSPSPSSPALSDFFTPPTSPPTPNPPPHPSPPVLQISIPHGPPPPASYSPPDDPFPSTEFPTDLALDDEGLSTLEKTYLFSRSKASFHRVFIANALPSFLLQVSPQEAIEYILPLLSGLAMDQDDQVKEALATHLVPIIWWFFSHCQIIPDDPSTEDSLYPSQPTISVQAFTPILGTLLLSPYFNVAEAARFAVVDLLSRMNNADLHDPSLQSSQHQEPQFTVGLFLPHERAMFRNEILQQVVIGMGRLDLDSQDHFHSTPDEPPPQYPWQPSVHIVTPIDQLNDEEGISDTDTEVTNPNNSITNPKSNDRQSVNPYFPVLASSYSVPSPASSTSSTPSSTGSLPSSASSSSSGALSAHSSPSLSKEPFSSPGNPTSASASASDSTPTPADSEPLASTDEPMPLESPPADWIPPAPRPSHATLPLPTWPPLDSFRSNTSTSPPPADTRHFNITDLGTHGTSGLDSQEGYEGEQDGQATVGRISSMSLIATVTASVNLTKETQEAFVKEVERVGRDPVYLVRREASFALGALAKVVPEEIVFCALLPLFNSLRRDSICHVRHSALLALPAILPRLSFSQRRSLALETIVTLSTDKSPAVRAGVLEALGEVIYTFHLDEGGPPEKLIQMFLGRKEDKRVRDGQQSSSPQQSASASTDLESFYTSPERPLVCAFNFPAVALTLGRERWPELREVYLDIATNRASKVRRTLAASLGELAKIIGQVHAQRDLVGIWWDAIRCGEEEEDVRGKAVECVDVFVMALGVEAGSDIVQGLVTVWDEGVFKGWRERQGIASALVRLFESVGQRAAFSLVELLQRALEDNVAAVRETAISALPQIWASLAGQTNVLIKLRDDLQNLAKSSIHRRRMTFVACQQVLITPGFDGTSIIPIDDEFWTSVSHLADDPIIGVRIGVARLVGVISESLLPGSQSISDSLHDLIGRLSQDPSHDVRSYVPDSFSLHRSHDNVQPTSPVNFRLNTYHDNLSTFSRPPPVRAPSHGASSSSSTLSLPISKDSGGIPHADRTFGGSRSSDLIDV